MNTSYIKELLLGYTDEQVSAILNHLEGTYENENIYNYADNLRIARKGNVIEENYYMDNYNKGCCGYYDNEIVVGDTVIKIGFNYGH